MDFLDVKEPNHYSSEMPKAMTVSAAEANRSFSRLLREAEAGTEITITSRGEPKFKLLALANPDAASRRLQEAYEALADGWADSADGWADSEFRVVGPWTREELYERD